MKLNDVYNRNGVEYIVTGYSLTPVHDAYKNMITKNEEVYFVSTSHFSSPSPISELIEVSPCYVSFFNGSKWLVSSDKYSSIDAFKQVWPSHKNSPCHLLTM